MISHNDYVTYFKEIAIKHKQLLHTENSKVFHEVSMDLIAGDTSGMFAKTCMLLETESGRIYGPNWSTMYDTPDFAFVIAKSCKLDNRTEERQILDDCKRIGFQILAKIKKDYMAGHALMKLVDIGSFQYAKVYGFGDNHFGWRFTLTMKDNAALKYEAADWND
jgi:hypothetical protein